MLGIEDGERKKHSGHKGDDYSKCRKSKWNRVSIGKKKVSPLKTGSFTSYLLSLELYENTDLTSMSEDNYLCKIRGEQLMDLFKAIQLVNRIIT